MSALRKKLFRDIRRSKWQFTALIVMVVLGISFFGSVLSSYRNLQLSVDKPYEDLRFADITVTFGSGPQNISDLVASVPGVERVTGRINIELPSTFSYSSDRFVGRVVTLPAPARPSVNDVLVTAGAYFTEPNRTQVLVEKAFADHHGVELGDGVAFITPVGVRNFTVSGIVISPEYLWPARTVWDHMPDVLRRWGVFFAPYASVASTVGLTGRINEIAVTIRDASQLDEVETAMRNILSPYGITSLVPREKQPSNVTVNMSVQALDTLSYIFPAFFLTIVALSTYVLLTRIVFVQRQQVGVLLALGVSRKSVLQHYLSFALLVGLGGSLIGSLGGYLLASPVTNLFVERVSLPLVYKTVHWDVMASGIVLALSFSSVAGLVPALRAARLMPAKTMRGESPRSSWSKKRQTLGIVAQESSTSISSQTITGLAKATILVQSGIIIFLAYWIYQEYKNNLYLQAYLTEYFNTNLFPITTLSLASLSIFSTSYALIRFNRNKKSRLDNRLLPRRSKLPASLKLPFRSLRRNPVRTVFTVLALALAGSMIIVPLGFIDSMNYLVDANARSSAFDLQALFYTPQPENVATNLTSWAGVRNAESFILYPTLLGSGGKTLDIQLYGLRGDADLYRLYTLQDVRVYARQGEIFLSKVFEKNGVQRGDIVRIGQGWFKVGDFLSGLSDTGFVDMGDAQRALGIPGMVNGIVLTTDGSISEESIQSQLYSSLPVWSVLSTEKALQDTNDMLSLYYGFVDIIIVSGLLISLAIVFNFVMINVLERSREVATMRTIGMGTRSIAAIFTLENLAVLAAGIALGSVLGLYLTGYFVTLFQSDLFVLTSRIRLATYAQAGLLLLIVLLLSELPGIRSVYRMDLAKTTKERVG